MKYYLLGLQNNTNTVIANAPDNTKLAHELVFEIEGDNLPFHLNLQKVNLSKNKLVESEDFSGIDNPWLDFIPNSLAWPLMSKKMKDIIEENLTGKEGIEWVKAKILLKNDKKEYYIPRFSKKMDVLDEKKTKYVPGTDQIIKPAFSNSKIKNYVVFHKPTLFWKITNELYVNEKLKNDIEENKLTGIKFEETPISS